MTRPKQNGNPLLNLFLAAIPAGVLAGFFEALRIASKILDAQPDRPGLTSELGGFGLFAMAIYAALALAVGIAAWISALVMIRAGADPRWRDLLFFAAPVGFLVAFFPLIYRQMGGFNTEPVNFQSLAIAAGATLAAIGIAALATGWLGEAAMRRVRNTLAVLAALALAGAAGAHFGTAAPQRGGRGAASGKTNLLLIVVDTLRADHLGAYEYPHLTSPSLDNLASSGVVFEHAFAHMPATVPSHASLFTSRYPHQHQAYVNGMSLSPKLKTLAEHLQDAGYATAAVVTNSLLNRRYGFDQGFDSYVEINDFDYAGTHPAAWRHELYLMRIVSRVAHLDPTTAIAKETLDHLAADGKPFFLWTHWLHPHAPYNPPRKLVRLEDYSGKANGSRAQIRRLQLGEETFSPEDAEYEAALYDGEIRFTDRQIGALISRLEELGLSEKTLVVITSDHGENMNEHMPFVFDHGETLYDSEIAVPLVISHPGKLPAQRIGDIFPQTDFLPTLLEYLEIPFDNTAMVGHSWRAQLGVDARTSAPVAAYGPVFFGELVLNERVAFLARDASFALIETRKGKEAKSEFYDLSRDAKQTYDLLDANARPMEGPQTAAYKRLTTALQAFIALHEQVRALVQQGGGGFSAFDDETRRRLESLGYIKK